MPWETQNYTRRLIYCLWWNHRQRPSALKKEIDVTNIYHRKRQTNWNYSKQSIRKLYVVRSTSRSHALSTKSSIKWLCHVIKWLCHVLLVIFVPCSTTAIIDSILFNVIHEHISDRFFKGSFIAPVRTTWEQRNKKPNKNLRVRSTLSQIAHASPTT